MSNPSTGMGCMEQSLVIGGCERPVTCAGARFDDRITGVVSKYAPEAYVIHFDVKSEHNKNVRAHFPIQSSNTLCKDW